MANLLAALVFILRIIPDIVRLIPDLIRAYNMIQKELDHRQASDKIKKFKKENTGEERAKIIRDALSS